MQAARKAENNRYRYRNKAKIYKGANEQTGIAANIYAHHVLPLPDKQKTITPQPDKGDG